jgi:hypothetical protein
VGPELKLRQTVVIGAFNPAIITPDWLDEFDLCRPDGEFALSDQPDASGFQAGGFEWEVDSASLSISVEGDKTADCGAMAARVLALLPHTPVEAVGHNFQYLCPENEWVPRVLPRIGGRGAGELPGVGQVRWDGRFERPHGWVEVTLIQDHLSGGKNYIAVLFNHHYVVEAATLQSRAEAARLASKEFATAAEETVRMMGELFRPDGGAK